jgi:hypothetical protein
MFMGSSLAGVVNDVMGALLLFDCNGGNLFRLPPESFRTVFRVVPRGREAARFAQFPDDGLQVNAHSSASAYTAQVQETASGSMLGEKHFG